MGNRQIHDDVYYTQGMHRKSGFCSDNNEIKFKRKDKTREKYWFVTAFVHLIRIE